MSTYLHGPHRDPYAPWGWSSEPRQLTVDVQFQSCPDCGHRSDVDGWDCLGADDDNVFCPRCWAEVRLVPEIEEVPVSGEAAKILEEMKEQPEQPNQQSLFPK